MCQALCLGSAFWFILTVVNIQTPSQVYCCLFWFESQTDWREWCSC
jgi:hypothetical protein